MLPSTLCALVLVLFTVLVLPYSALPFDRDIRDPVEHTAADLDETDTQHEHEQGIPKQFEDTSAPKAAKIRAGTKRDSKHESFQGIPNYVRGGHNVTKVSHMLYRAIKQYKINSMVDVPCRAHSRWMGEFLEHVEWEDNKPFSYYCVDSSKKILDLAASRMPQVTGVSVNCLRRKFWRERIPRADLVFCWEGLEKMKIENVKRFFEMLKEGKRHKYLLVGSSPGAKSNSEGLVLNVRRAPYSYGMPMRIYKQLAVEQDPVGKVVTEKQMYLYRIADMEQGEG